MQFSRLTASAPAYHCRMTDGLAASVSPHGFVSVKPSSLLWEPLLSPAVP